MDELPATKRFRVFITVPSVENRIHFRIKKFYDTIVFVVRYEFFCRLILIVSLLCVDREQSNETELNNKIIFGSDFT